MAAVSQKWRRDVHRRYAVVKQGSCQRHQTARHYSREQLSEAVNGVLPLDVVGIRLNRNEAKFV